ncbi:MAG: deoxyguanosinetriphosphate triphosphohydrolase [Rhodospirillales bacterium]|nr:deoxyguanosinetriphosphate triphosphohydrolase [Rhodospirillales bacterium]
MSGQGSFAPFATRPDQSRGRLHAEPESRTRTCFQRDRDRIIHCSAFRRLQYKTQVFVNHEGDFYRTRLTHSLEVAQIARSLARSLGLDEDLSEVVALAHDLGHPPFGHAGEDGLKVVMAPFGGFDHNAQTLRAITRLERRYPGFDGLNLTWEALEGIVKHNGPLTAGGSKKPVPRDILEYTAEHDLALATWPSAEAQVAAIADDIAYNNHDIEDGLRAGLFVIGDLSDLPLVGPAFVEVARRYPDLETSRCIHQGIRDLIGAMVGDVLAETRRRVAALNPTSPAAVAALGQPLVSFSDTMRAHDRALKAFLHERMYRHYRLNRMTSKARRLVQELFTLFLAEPECLPTEWRAMADQPQTETTARVVCDYIAGMTDRFALDEHGRVFDAEARSG